MTQLQYALSSRSEASKSEKVLAILREFPYRTSQELAAKVNPGVVDAETIHKRLPELRKKGLVKNANFRICTVTHRRAQTWFPAEGV
jgi:predicted HTH transcriptional regulator